MDQFDFHRLLTSARNFFDPEIIACEASITPFTTIRPANMVPAHSITFFAFVIVSAFIECITFGNQADHYSTHIVLEKSLKAKYKRAYALISGSKDVTVATGS